MMLASMARRYVLVCKQVKTIIYVFVDADHGVVLWK